MKRIISTLLVCILLVGSVFALASCGGPSGTYKDALTGLTTIEFKGKEATISIGNASTTAEFKMSENDDGDKIITFIFADGEEAKGFEGDLPYSEGNEDGEKYIKIGLLKYIKQ